MLDVLLVGFLIIIFGLWILSKPIIRLINIFSNWIRLIRFIKKGRENNNCIFKINTTSDKIIITTNDWRSSKDIKERLSLNYK